MERHTAKEVEHVHRVLMVAYTVSQPTSHNDTLPFLAAAAEVQLLIGADDLGEDVEDLPSGHLKSGANSVGSSNGIANWRTSSSYDLLFLSSFYWQ